MPDLKVTFKLSSADLKRLREIFRKTKTTADEPTAIAAAEQLMTEVRAASPPDYVVSRVGKLELLIGMLKDVGWPLPRATRDKAVSALSYFTDPRDLLLAVDGRWITRSHNSLFDVLAERSDVTLVYVRRGISYTVRYIIE